MSADAPMTSAPIIAVYGLGKTYPNGTCAVADVSLQVHPGEFIAIIGSSGAGKSTLLRCLNRLVRPTGGRYELDGVDVTDVSGARLRHVRQQVGMIFQQFNVVGRLNVIDNVLAGRLRFNQPSWRDVWYGPRGPRPWHLLGRWLCYLASLARWLSPADRQAAFDHLRQVGIEQIAFQRADTLSGGQQQRVAIARVLAQDPDVLLADEPIASLDPRSARQVMDTLQTIQQTRGIPVIVNLHQVDIAIDYATRIIAMARGHVVFDGPPTELTDEITTRVYAGAADAPASPASIHSTQPTERTRPPGLEVPA